MNYARVRSYAKINLTLDVLGRAEGYHLIDSLVASIDLYDLVTVKERRDRLISVTMRGEGSENIPYEANNAVLAAEGFMARFGCNGVDVTISKNIPIGAGLGGSSADAAGVINAMAKLYGVTDGEALEELASGIGSDCAYMLKGGYARLGGRGEKVTPIACGLKLYLGLLIPKQGVSAGECYKKYDALESTPLRATEGAVSALLSEDLNGLGKCLSNSLYLPATAINGDVVRAYSYLQTFAPLGVNMTGSGSCVYALFENDQFVQYALSRNKSGFRFVPAKTVIPAVR